MKRTRKSRNLAVEALENRHMLSGDSIADTDLFDPSALEQEMLEHLNRMRMAPQAELDILFSEPGVARDPDARLAMTVFQDPSAEEIADDWSKLYPVAPVAWNEDLYDAAYDHTLVMVQYDDQSHQLPGEKPVPRRLADAGYPAGATVGENIYAYMNNVFHGHSAFAIDWGVADRSHRDNMMSPTFREVGISIVPEDDIESDVGPLLVTQDYGDGRGMVDSCLLGVVWEDIDDNDMYDAGEGLGNVEILIEGTGGTFYATSMTAGGYQTFVPKGIYTVTAYGGALPAPMTFHDVLMGDDNVKVDFQYDPDDAMAPVVDLNGPAETGITYQTTFVEGSVPVPIVSIDGFVKDDDSEQLAALTAVIENLREPGEYLVADTTGTPISASYDAPSGLLTLTGFASVADYRQVLGTLAYVHAGEAIDETPRIIEVVASDGEHFSRPATATVDVVRTTLPEVVIADLRVEEHPDGANYALTIQLTDSIQRSVSVDVATVDDSAIAGSDYTPIIETVHFAPGETVKTVSIVLIDDDVPEADETFGVVLSNPVGATIADALGVVTIVDDDAIVELDEVDFYSAEGIDLTSASRQYEITAGQDGVLSVEASGESDSEITLLLYDEYSAAEPVMTVQSIDGVARLDLTAVSADETYHLEVTGTASDAKLLLGNLVQQNGEAFVVSGTAEDDVFTFDATSDFEFAINGLSYSYLWDEAESVTFRGGEGNDEASLTGGVGNDTAQLFPGRGSLIADEYAVTLEEVEAIQVRGNGGDDTAKLYDSPGDDTFAVEGGNGGLTGDGFANAVEEFGAVMGYATSGGDDTVKFVGTEADEDLIAKPALSRVMSDTYYQRAKYFDRVTVVGNGGVDVARLDGSEGIDHFVGAPNSGEMTGDGFSYQVEDYLAIHGYSRGWDQDTAVLTDSPGDDTLVVSPIFAKMYGDGFLTRAKFFPNIEIVASAQGTDSARLYDSEGDDEIVIDVAGSTISGPGYARELEGFENVSAYSREGGADVVTIHDTPGNDMFVAAEGMASLAGDGFLAYAYRFADVRASAMAGGVDTATLEDSSGDDEFHSLADISSISGPGYYVEARLFETVLAYCVQGGNDTARFVAGVSDSVFRGGLTASSMDEAGYHRRANAFEAVYAEAGNALDTAIFEGSGRDDDLFESGDDWSRLSNGSLDAVVEAREFELVYSPFEDDEGSELFSY